ncbi:MAG: FAD-dependent oxidoreductase, partial [Oscillospiraceae bacterium]|nr:FAD-dependent oxidoreductase [Oscillospiraceae bacterium]
MIRIREIALPPEHNVAQLSFEAAQALRISVSKIRKLTIVRRSVDARKKPDVKIVYTVDVAVDGNEQKILKQS